MANVATLPAAPTAPGPSMSADAEQPIDSGPSDTPVPAIQAQDGGPRRPHICVATPCYGYQVFQNYLIGMIELTSAVSKSGEFEISFIIRGGDSLITRCRNSMVAEFLSNPAYTHLFWIDGDIGFQPDAVFRLLRSDYEVACGIYPLKSFNLPDKVPQQSRDEVLTRYLSYPFSTATRTFPIHNGFVELRDAPGGFMLIRRTVFSRLIQAFPELKYKPEGQLGLEGLSTKIDEFYYNFFDTTIDSDGIYLSEDYSFARLCGRAGIKIYGDIESDLTHFGAFLYKGNLSARLNIP